MDSQGGAATASGSEVLLRPRLIQGTTINSIAVGFLRDEAQLISNELADLHNHSRQVDLDKATSLRAWDEPRDLLRTLSVERGLAWVQIARLVGVTVPALRKWRQGAPAEPANRRRLAALCVFLEELSKRPIPDPAAWLELRLSEQSTLTGLDIYAGERADLLMDYAAGRLGPLEVLDRFDPDWRRQTGPNLRFQVLPAPDGGLGIVELRDH